MPEISIVKSLNKAYRQVSIDQQSFDNFKTQLSILFNQTDKGGSEEVLKGYFMDFLKNTFYGNNYKVSPNGNIDCAIHLGNNIETPVGVICEIKAPSNTSEMITRDNINKKAMQELLLYWLRERVGKKNIQLKNLIVTNINEFFVFDAQEFERVFHSNSKLLKRFSEFNSGVLTSEKTNFFYKEIAAETIENIKKEISYTWFDIRNFKKALLGGPEKRLIELYKFFSPEHLLKKPFQNDSNSLNKKFYNELLYIIGLEEVEDKKSHKRIITRKAPEYRNPASILENTLTILDSEDWLDNIPNRSFYGKNQEEQLFNIALELTIGWINRILFLKLLEAQLIKYHKGDASYSFLSPLFIPDYDELNKLFFQVLAKQPINRSAVINNKFGKIPYLNSSLFEVSELERKTIRISSLDNSELPLYGATILKDGQKTRYKKLPTLRYLLEFLEAYDFSGEGSEKIQSSAKTLINASVLGLIFEKINGHKDGAIFTPGAITMFMCREAVQAAVVRKFNERLGWKCNDYSSLKDKEITDYIQANEIIDSLRICDPAVGSGHYLVSALNEIIQIKYDLGVLLDSKGTRIKKQDWTIENTNDELIVSDFDGDPFIYIPGNKELQRIQEAIFKEKRKIIEDCLFGVDINPNAVNICRLRLWIELLKNAYYTRESNYQDLETLPNIDINIKNGNSLIHRFDINLDISEIKSTSHTLISKYKDSVKKYKNAHSKEEKKELDSIITNIKATLGNYISESNSKVRQRKRLEKELSLFQTPHLIPISEKEQKEEEKKIEAIKLQINSLNKEIKAIQNNKMYSNAFEWRIEFPEILDNEGQYVGFDCIIGNPPYIQLQKMGEDTDNLKKMNYQTFERTGDIYCLFYELGIKLLKPNAILSYITSNKWMRAGYGEKTRNFFATQTNPLMLIDFGSVQIFDSATVDTNILFLHKSSNEHKTHCVITPDKECVHYLSDFVRRNSVTVDFATSDSWVILSPIEQSIKRKIEAAGTPLKDWDIQINYGIKTGCNEAFIISTEKRNEILSNCADEDERRRTEELIRPILRGRDISRYGYNWANLWLINTHNGIKGKYDRIHIEDYTAVKAHLDQYWNKISTREDKGDTPYNLRNCAYLDDFSKPKIVWGNLNLKASYTLIGDYFYINAPAAMIIPYYPIILAVLNSIIGDFYIRLLGVTRNGGYFEYKPMFIDRLPVPKLQEQSSLNETLQSMIESFSHEKIERTLFKIYDLNDEEIDYLLGSKL